MIIIGNRHLYNESVIMTASIDVVCIEFSDIALESISSLEKSVLRDGPFSDGTIPNFSFRFDSMCS